MFKTWSIGMRIGGAFTLAIATIVGLSAVSLHSTSSFIDAAGWRSHTHEVLAKIGDVTASLKDAEAGEAGFIITGEDRYPQLFNEASSHLDGNIAEVQRLTIDNAAQQQNIERLKAAVADKLADGLQNISIRRDKGVEVATAAFKSEKGRQLIDKVTSILDDIRHEEETLLVARTEEAESTARLSTHIMTFGGGFAALFILLTGVVLSRGISLPLREITGIAEQIAGGDLSGRIPSLNRDDEVGRLAVSFGKMSQWLQEMAKIAGEIAGGNLRVKIEPRSDRDILGIALTSMVANLRNTNEVVGDTVNKLAASSKEILAAVNQQTAGASETASSVNETVSTVEEVTQTADQTAQRAKAVRETAQRSIDVTQKGQKAVEDAMNVMTTVREQVESVAETILGLAEQTQAIGEIIATVNDIAEQTNLLALNAAIEASRASGESGRGFSVVANEIKVLADQSKKATARVRQIIEEIQKGTNSAVMATEQGTKSVDMAAGVVNQAGETILKLAEAIAEGAEAANQIVASVSQQATGMGQISQAIQGIHQATVQNQAASQQTQSAARDLDVLGSKLKELVIA